MREYKKQDVIGTFMKLFLKLSDRKAYRTGLMAEFEYPRQLDSRKMTTTTGDWLALGGVKMSDTCATQ